jgi:asparagine synthase (glutamine-hydrolysing)
MRLAGIVTSAPDATGDLHRMLGAMARGASGRSGMHAFADAGVWIGWVDERPAGAPTIVSEHQGRTLFFGGEHIDERTDIAVGAVDGRALCAEFDRERVEWVRRLNGWFAGVVVDAPQREATIFTDRLGLRRVYYAEWDGVFAFASEAKALLAIRRECREFDVTGLGEFFAIGCVSGDATLFRDVKRMPGGAVWRLRRSSPVVKRAYITATELEQQPALSPAGYRDAMYAAMERVVPRYFRDNDRSAVSLTGGLDSRALMAFSGGVRGPKRAYTYGGMYREPYDVTIGRRVAAASGFDHQVIVLGDQFVRQFADLAETTVRITDGTADVLVAHEVFLSRLARQIAPVRITGNFGSEIFRGVSQFKPLGLPPTLFRPDFLPQVLAPETVLRERKGAHPISFAIFQELPSRLYGRLAAAQSELTVRTPFTDNEFLALAYRAPSAEHDVQADWIDAIRRRSPSLAAIPTDRLRLGAANGWRASLARLYNTLQFKAEWHYDLGMRHGLVRADDVLCRRTPPSFVGTHKIEHYRRWFRRGPMLDYASGVLTDAGGGASRLYDYVDRPVVETMLREHHAGTKNYTAEIAMLTTVALTARLVVDHPYGEQTAERTLRHVEEHVAG